MYQKTKQKFEALLGRDDIVILGLESSCDETAAAVTCGRRVLSNAVASQAEIHRRFGGVVPEVASRNHTLSFTGIIDAALKDAGKTLDQIDAVAVTSHPGLIGSLLVGVSTAKALCFAKNIPLISVNHIEAHICANYAEYGLDTAGAQPKNLSGNSDGANTQTKDSLTDSGLDTVNPHSKDSKHAEENSKSFLSKSVLQNDIILNLNPHPKNSGLQPPFLALVASGGHTSIIDVRGYNDFQLVGRTTDDAIGEAFDKVARQLGLPYPGGPSVDLCAQKGRPVIEFFRKKGVKKDYSLSYSGLKTAVVNYLHNLSQRGEAPDINDICASFTVKAMDMLVSTLLAAAGDLGRDTIAIAGGVASNSYLRKNLLERAGNIRILMPPPHLCTDNAVMVALRGFYSAKEGKNYSGLDLKAASV